MTLPRNKHTSIPPLWAKLFADLKISENENEETEWKKRQQKAEAGKDGTVGRHQAKFIATRKAQIEKLKDPLLDTANCCYQLSK